jgi:hypothetical protein
LPVFDAAGAGWDMVDAPQLARSEDGSLHAVFTRYSLPGGSGPMGLFYTRSEDGGIFWSPPELVDENPVHWSRVVSGKAGVLHRIWQARAASGSGFMLWHQYSLDNGYNWSASQNISNFGLVDPGINASLAVGPTDDLHFLHTISGQSGELSLYHWAWTGDQWQRKEDLKMNINQVHQIHGLSAAASSLGRVAVLYSVPPAAEGASQNISGSNLFFSIRALDISIPPSAPLPPLPSSPTPTLDPILEPTITPTPALDLSVLANEPPSRSTTNRWAGLGLGLSVAGILVGIAFGFGVLSIRRKK